MSDWSRDLARRLLNGVLTVDEMARTIESDEGIQRLVGTGEVVRKTVHDTHECPQAGRES